MAWSRLAWVGMLAGCGIVEGSEDLLDFECERLDSEEVTDPSVGVFGLPPLGTRAEAVTGTFAVSADVTSADGAEGPYPGTVTISLTGPPTAENRELAEGMRREVATVDPCPDRYRVPAQIAIDLDDDVFSVTVDAELSFTDDELIVGLIEASERDYWPIDLVSTTLDLPIPSSDLEADRVGLVLWEDEEVQALRIRVLLSDDVGGSWEFLDLGPI